MERQKEKKRRRKKKKEQRRRSFSENDDLTFLSQSDPTVVASSSSSSMAKSKSSSEVVKKQISEIQLSVGGNPRYIFISIIYSSYEEKKREAKKEGKEFLEKNANSIIIAKARDQKTGNIVAIKRQTLEEKGICTGIHESTIAKSISSKVFSSMDDGSKYITQVIDCYNDDHFRSNFLVLEYACGGSLFDFVEKYDVSLQNFYRFFVSIVDGLYYLHEVMYVAHRDIKLENFLIFYDNDRRPYLKFTDFGYSTMISNGRMVSDHCGSAHYAAPELFEDSTKIASLMPFQQDIWAVASVVFILVFKQHMFNMDNRESVSKSYQLQKYMQENFDRYWTKFVLQEIDFPPQFLCIYKQLYDFFYWCFQKQGMRITAFEIKETELYATAKEYYNGPQIKKLDLSQCKKEENPKTERLAHSDSKRFLKLPLYKMFTKK